MCRRTPVSFRNCAATGSRADARGRGCLTRAVSATAATAGAVSATAAAGTRDAVGNPATPGPSARLDYRTRRRQRPRGSSLPSEFDLSEFDLSGSMRNPSADRGRRRAADASAAGSGLSRGSSAGRVPVVVSVVVVPVVVVLWFVVPVVVSVVVVSDVVVLVVGVVVLVVGVSSWSGSAIMMVAITGAAEVVPAAVSWPLPGPLPPCPGPLLPDPPWPGLATAVAAVPGSVVA